MGKAQENTQMCRDSLKKWGKTGLAFPILCFLHPAQVSSGGLLFLLRCNCVQRPWLCQQRELSWVERKSLRAMALKNKKMGNSPKQRWLWHCRSCYFYLWKLWNSMLIMWLETKPWLSWRDEPAAIHANLTPPMAVPRSHDIGTVALRRTNKCLWFYRKRLSFSQVPKRFEIYLVIVF